MYTRHGHSHTLFLIEPLGPAPKTREMDLGDGRIICYHSSNFPAWIFRILTTSLKEVLRSSVTCFDSFAMVYPTYLTG